MKTLIGDSGTHRNPKPKPGYSIWIESGKYYTSQTVDPELFGPHAYANGEYDHGIRDCPCGCSMGSSNSSGPVDPFGACPSNPKAAWPNVAAIYPGKICIGKGDVPVEGFAAVKFGVISIPGDERSRTNPGHGYPEHDQPTTDFVVFKDEPSAKDWVGHQTHDNWVIIRYQTKSVNVTRVVELI